MKFEILAAQVLHNTATGDIYQYSYEWRENLVKQ